MANKKRSASSSRWLQEHFSDKYVQQAQKKGFAHVHGLNWMKSSKVIKFLNQV
ncbi:hypothetical protein PS9952019_20120 [Providencia stuartii]|nr:hypothetical protein PS9952019_20120 [Providencia stuartii]